MLHSEQELFIALLNNACVGTVASDHKTVLYSDPWALFILIVRETDIPRQGHLIMLLRRRGRDLGVYRGGFYALVF